MKVTVIPIVGGALETIPKGVVKWRFRNQRTRGDHPDYSIMKIGQNTGKSPGDSRRLVFIQTRVRNRQLMLVRKTLESKIITIIMIMTTTPITITIIVIIITTIRRTTTTQTRIKQSSIDMYIPYNYFYTIYILMCYDVICNIYVRVFVCVCLIIYIYIYIYIYINIYL